MESVWINNLRNPPEGLGNVDFNRMLGLMTWTEWVSFASVCLLGAMSPGPSLAIVVRYTLEGGRIAGVICALSHGMGIFIWGALMVGGVGFLVANEPRWFAAIQLVGVVYLLYLGICALFQEKKEVEVSLKFVSTSRAQAAIEGFLIALLNPKIAVFFMALFSQFIHVNAHGTERMMLAMTVASIDATWYVLVVILLSHTKMFERLKSQNLGLNRLFGVVVVIFAAGILVRW